MHIRLKRTIHALIMCSIAALPIVFYRLDPLHNPYNAMITGFMAFLAVGLYIAALAEFKRLSDSAVHGQHRIEDVTDDHDARLILDRITRQRTIGDAGDRHV